MNGRLRSEWIMQPPASQPRPLGVMSRVCDDTRLGVSYVPSVELRGRSEAAARITISLEPSNHSTDLNSTTSGPFVVIMLLDPQKIVVIMILDSQKFFRRNLRP